MISLLLLLLPQDVAQKGKKRFKLCDERLDKQTNKPCHNPQPRLAAQTSKIILRELINPATRWRGNKTLGITVSHADRQEGKRN